MASVVVFGLQDTAQLAHHYLTTDSPHEVVAFTVHERFLAEKPSWLKAIRGIPVVAFEQVEKLYPPDLFHFFAPMTGAGMNKKREAVYLEAKKKGYRFINYVSTKATNLALIMGENCFILEDNTIQPFVQIGNNVVLWSGNHIGHHSNIESNVFFTSHVVLSGHCQVKAYSWFGVNSTIRDALTIEQGTLVGMGACVTKNTEPWSVYLGLPAKKVEGTTSLEANP